jgi:hypothetical protein
MEPINQPNSESRDLFDGQPKKLPGMLNVLTILTFIGCGLGYFSVITSLFTNSNFEKQKAQMEDLQDQIGESGGLAGDMMKGSMEMAQKSYDNRYILLVSGLLFTTMCLIGALQMRKLKKSGYPIYMIGELAPLIVSARNHWLWQFVGQHCACVTLIFAALFAILYTTQRKYLVN